MPPRFTFIRAESLREAGLAKRNMNLKHTQDQSNSVMGMNQFCQEPLAVESKGKSFLGCSEKVREVDQEFNHDFSRNAVRKLFNDDLPGETNGPSLSNNDFNEGESLGKFPDYHGELERLSYINSQEPGELSQINALDCVDRFLKSNFMELNQENNCVKKLEKKSESLPRIKGQQSLSKIINDRSKAKKTEIFDWDDNCEDEGGGELYRRRKDDFVEGGTRRPRSLPGCRKNKSCRSNGDKEEEEQSSIPIKRKNAAHSESRLGMHNLKIRDDNIQEPTRKLERNLANEMDEQFNGNFSRGELDPNGNADRREMLDVGLDTQMAAEAMEALFNAGDIVDHVANDSIRITRSRSTYQLNDSSTGKMGLVTPKEHTGKYDRKRKADVKSDLQTSGLSKKYTKKVGQCRKGNVTSRSQKRKLIVEGNQTTGANKSGRIVSSPIGEQRKSAEALKNHQLNELNNLDSNDGGGTVNEKQFQGEVFHLTPIARRTRQSLAGNKMINCDKSLKSLSEKAMRIDPHEKCRGVGLQASEVLAPKSTLGSSDHSPVDDNTELCQHEKLASKENAVGVSNDFAVDMFDYPRRRRSLRIMKLPHHDKDSEKSVGSSKSVEHNENIGKSTSVKKKTRTSAVVKSHVNCHTEKANLENANSGGIPICCDNLDENDANLNSNVKNNADARLSSNHLEFTISDESPRDRYKSPDLATTTPSNCKTPVNNASPVCMSDDYYKQSRNRNVSRSCLLKVFRKDLQRELRSLSAIRPELITPSKDSRKRKDMTDVRILYSHHLDEDIIKHQKKVW